MRNDLCRILVVDDSVGAAKILASILGKVVSNDVEMAHDGPAALKAAEHLHPEVIFLDIGLPGMDGYEVARRLRRQPQFKKTVLIALTGYEGEENRRRSIEAGFDHHLVKPVGPDTLQHLLTDVAVPREESAAL